MLSHSTILLQAHTAWLGHNAVAPAECPVTAFGSQTRTHAVVGLPRLQQLAALTYPDAAPFAALSREHQGRVALSAQAPQIIRLDPV